MKKTYNTKKKVSRRGNTKKNIKKISNQKNNITQAINHKYHTNQIIKLIEKHKLKNPNNLRVGYISKSLPPRNTKYIIKKQKGIKYYTIASKEDIKCKEDLENNIKKFIGMYKTKKSPFKKNSQAVGFAIKQTRKQHPKCLAINTKYNRKYEGHFAKRIKDNAKYKAKKLFYKLFGKRNKSKKLKPIKSK